MKKNGKKNTGKAFSRMINNGKIIKNKTYSEK